jgi:hypothetical protein
VRCSTAVACAVCLPRWIAYRALRCFPYTTATLEASSNATEELPFACCSVVPHVPRWVLLGCCSVVACLPRCDMCHKKRNVADELQRYRSRKCRAFVAWYLAYHVNLPALWSLTPRGPATLIFSLDKTNLEEGMCARRKTRKMKTRPRVRDCL